jgi:hypothetical protein
MRKLAGLVGLMAMGVAVAGPLPETAFRKTPYVGAIAVDAQTGKVLFEDHADTVARPASVVRKSLQPLASARRTSSTGWAAKRAYAASNAS